MISDLERFRLYEGAERMFCVFCIRVQDKDRSDLVKERCFMHPGYPKVGDPIQSFIQVCGQPAPQSTDDMILFDIPGINAVLTCWIDEEKNVHKLSSSMPMGAQAAVELAKRFLPEGSSPVETHIDTESEKLNANIQTYEFEQNGQTKQVGITADESGSFTVAVQQ